MRHAKRVAKLGRTSAHREAMLRNMATSLLKREKIKTTKQKAKAVRSYVEKLITKARVDSVHNKRTVAKKIKDRNALIKLFNDIAPRYANRPGGYTRIYKLGFRPGDAAEMVMIELVEEEMTATRKKSSSKKKAVKAEKPAEKTTPEVESGSEEATADESSAQPADSEAQNDSAESDQTDKN